MAETREFTRNVFKNKISQIEFTNAENMKL